MLSFQDFFNTCSGFWTTERTYHSMPQGVIERSYTEFRVKVLDGASKQHILSGSDATSGPFAGIKIDEAQMADANADWPGFAIAFETRSETGEEVSMTLTALFVPDAYVVLPKSGFEPLVLPTAAQVDDDVIQGFYLRDQGYSEAGAIAGRFTYQPTRQTLEMITYYRRSVAVDQMRLVAPDLRLRTIVTYQRPAAGAVPTEISLIGFGVEQKQP